MAADVGGGALGRRLECWRRESSRVVWRVWMGMSGWYSGAFVAVLVVLGVSTSIATVVDIVSAASSFLDGSTFIQGLGVPTQLIIDTKP